jgi:hypothetical protein
MYQCTELPHSLTVEEVDADPSQPCHELVLQVPDCLKVTKHLQQHLARKCVLAMVRAKTLTLHVGMIESHTQLSGGSDFRLYSLFQIGSWWYRE